MRLARKLALAFLIGIVLVLAANAYFRIRTDTQVFEDDIRRDHRLIARVLLPAVRRVWLEDGKSRALQLLEEANQGISRLSIHWVSDDDPAMVLEVREAFAMGGVPLEATRKVDGTLQTFIRDDQLGGALKLEESLEEEANYARNAVIRASLTALAMVMICSALAWALGIAFVAKPVAKMIAKSRRIGIGDFGTPLDLRTNDELAELAGEMNAMCDRLGRETEARIDAQDQLRHAERLTTVGKLASGIAHELGTPINVIAARAKMIRGGRVDEANVGENCQIITEQCDRMAQIIRQLLDFARSNVSAKRTAIDLGSLVRDTTELLHPIALKRGATIATNVDENVAVRGDRTQLQQVLSNLIINALQSMTSGGEVMLDVGPGRPRELETGAMLGRVRVRDRGAGIPPEILPHVFEPFFTTKDVGEGTGLGLSVAHGIVKEHGGYIEVDTRPGEGTCFSVYLPLEMSA